ncbi:RNA polymerase sigma factor [Ideonella sp. DXS29W]|uniref:RNA polymerase sigma factor n=1 Tax=Ideonella lacteola TaxID=2984193 RepID=A0ABU9BM21_9BURK
MNAPTTRGQAPVPADAGRRDDDLVALLSGGQRELAFSRLAERYGTKVYRLCLAMLRDPARAEEAAQDALLRAWRSSVSYRPQAGSLSTWLYAITRNRCLSLLEKSALPAVSMSDEAVEAEAAALAAPQPHELHADAEAVLRELVEALPTSQRLALTLYYYEERSVADAAAMLGLPEATVKTHLHRGRQSLRARLAERGLADPALWL